MNVVKETIITHIKIIKGIMSNLCFWKFDFLWVWFNSSFLFKGFLSDKGGFSFISSLFDWISEFLFVPSIYLLER